MNTLPVSHRVVNNVFSNLRITLPTGRGRSDIYRAVGATGSMELRGISVDGGHTYVQRDAFESMAEMMTQNTRSDFFLSKDTPRGLREELLLARLGVIPGSYVDGIADVANNIEKPRGFDLAEYKEKRQRFSGYLSKEGADYMLLSDLNVQNWLLGGGDLHEITAQSVAKFLIPKDAARPIVIFINNIEQPRVTREELERRLGTDWAEHIILNVNPWHGSPDIDFVTGGAKVIADADDPSFHELHYSLTENDVQRYNWLSQMATAALVKTSYKIRFGEHTEGDVAGIVQRMLSPHEIYADVLLVAGADKMKWTNHPIPRSYDKVNGAAIMVLCARYGGYIANVSRIVVDGDMPASMERDFYASAGIATAANGATRPGNTYGDVFNLIMNGYKAVGFAQGAFECHAGGGTGIGIRDFCVSSPDDSRVIRPSQPFTWNPIVRGIKCEDTILTGKNTGEPARVLTVDPYAWWPMKLVNMADSADNVTIAGILQRK